jgi:UDP-GlcNAc:undecaprenyl-phosphate GlcNAc-1-phosphate transferase
MAAMMEMVLVFSTALVLALAVIPFVAKLAHAYGVLDLPDYVAGAPGSAGRQSSSQAPESRRVHANPIPRLGGIGIAVGFAVSVLIWKGTDSVGWIVAPSLLIFAIGLIDDFWPLSARLRFFAQVLITTCAVFFGDLWLRSVVLSEHLQYALPPWVGVPFSIFIVVGAINAVNMVDGLDGLAGGVVLIGVTLLSYLHVITTGSFGLLIGLSLPMIGGILGFLRYNSHPATIFMGDGGSNWLGFMTGMMMLVVLGGKPIGSATLLQDSQFVIQGSTSVPLLSAVLCLAVPVFDTACVIASRLRHGLHPMKADNRHFHHTLLRLGLSHSQCVSAVYFVALVAGVLGIAPVAFPRYHLTWVPYATAAMLLVLFPLGLKVTKGSGQMLITSALERRSQAINNRVRNLLRFWESANRYTIYAILLVAPLLAGAAPRNIGLVAGFAASALLLAILAAKGSTDFMQSTALAVAAGVLLIANNSNQIMIEFSGTRYEMQSVYNSLFIWLAISTFGFIATTARKNYLIIRPSDYLLVCIPLVLILIPEPFRSEYRFNVVGLRALVLFAALRTMVRRHQYSMRRFSVIAFAGLLYVFLAGVYGMRFVN